jgi:hypothetical protein
MPIETHIMDIEKNATPESSVENKSGPEAYLGAMESKKAVLDAFYQMNAFRGNKNPGDLTPEDRRNYDILKSVWLEKKQQNVAIIDKLDATTLDKVLSYGMNVHAVGAELTLLKYSKDSETVDSATPTEAPASTKGPVPLETSSAIPTPDTPTSGPEIGSPMTAPEVPPVPVVPRPERELSLTTERYREQIKQDRIRNFKSELVEIEAKLTAERAKVYGSEIERRGQSAEIMELEDRKKEIEAEIELLEKGAVGVFIDKVKSAYTRTIEVIKGDPTKKTKWGWVKERLKGFGTFGIAEIVSAERVRGGGNTAEAIYEASINQVNVDRATDADGIQDYAQKLQREAKNKGLSLVEVDRIHEADNDLFIENQANATVDEVMARIKKTKGEAGQNIDTPENRAAIKTGVITELTKIRQGRTAMSEVEMKKFVRDTLDDKWSRRYIYAGIEAALWAAGAASIIFRPEAIALPNVPHPSLFGPDTLPIPTGLEDQYVGMSNTVWETVSRMFPGASDTLIMAKSKVLMAANHMFEPEWTAKVIGEISSRTLPQSYLLKIPAGFIG